MAVEMTPEQAATVAEAIRRRREELKLTQKQVADAGGTSDQTVMFLEKGEQLRYQRRSIAAVEEGLRWASGSIEHGILVGEEPEEREWPDAPIDPSHVVPLTGRVDYGSGKPEVAQVLGVIDEIDLEIAWLSEALALLPSMPPLSTTPRWTTEIARRLGRLADEVLEFHAQLGKTIASLNELVDQPDEG